MILSIKKLALVKPVTKNNFLTIVLVLSFIFFSLTFFLILLSKNGNNAINPLTDRAFADFKSFNQFANQNGPIAAYNLLKLKYQQNEPAAHDFAHIVGIITFEKQGLAGLTICDNAFNYGCHHGLIETFLAKNDIAKVVEIENACLALGSIHAPSCIHGTGHGMMINSSYNLNRALSDCQRLQSSSRTYCWDGVFMERISQSMQTGPRLAVINKDNLNSPCNEIDKIYQKQCYRNQVSAWLGYFQGNTKNVGSQCNQIVADFRIICFESIGNLSAMNFDRLGIFGVTQLCKVLARDNYSDDCLFGLMDELMFEGKEAKLAQQLCVYVSTPKQNECQNRFARLYHDYQIRFQKQ